MRTLFILLTSLFIQLSIYSQDTFYYGFRCHNFKFTYVSDPKVPHLGDLGGSIEDSGGSSVDSGGITYNARIVFPDNPEPGRHWIWRARFWGHEPQTETALLKKGFHVVYIDAPMLCGGPEAVELWNQFYEYLVKTYDLNTKAVLEGMSRGGLYIYNWGAANPDKVACIYADAPVCDIRSWPGGKGKGAGSPDDWKLHLKVYGLTEETVDTFKGMPIYNCVKLARAGVPALHVCGAVDDVVPIEENTYVLEKAYKAAGGDIKVIVKEGIGHHPHSLKDPSPIVNFILSHTNPGLLGEAEAADAKMSIAYRSNTSNSRIRFEKEKKGTVAFLGGSITYNPGWRDGVSDYLRARFPDTEFNFIYAGIPSLGSVPHAMRFTADVLSNGTPDLLFVEAAVNDETNGASPEQMIRGMEGIVRHALQANPEMDIVMLHFADQDKMAAYNNGRVPVVIEQHEKVTEHYSLPSINLAKEVNDRILNGEFTWRDDFKNLHPSPFGQKLYFRTIKNFFDMSWKDASPETQVPHAIPANKLDKFSYDNGHFEAMSKAKKLKGWSIVNDWKPNDVPGREGFMDDDILEATEPGASFQIKFTGSAIGLFVTSGPDAGILEYSIDGAPFKKTDQYTKWSKSLHLPWLLMLEDELQEGRHKLIVRISADKNPESKGTACRVHRVAVN
jgi:pimeloyl-ACP methyl ester carboxylesterase/lysophospholipase L1-like esterase